MKRKQFLFILPFFPWPLTSGGHQAIFNDIRAVRDYADIHLVYYAGQKNKDIHYYEEFKRQIGGNVDIHPYVDHPLRWSRSMAFRKIANKLFKRIDYFSYLVFTKLHDAPVYDFVNRIIGDKQIDLVQMEMIETLDFVLTIPQDIPAVFIHHELRFVRNAQFLSHYGHDLYREALCKKECLLEVSLLNRYSLIMTLSEIDKTKLIDKGVVAPVYASFAIVNSEALAISEDYSGSHILTYVGPESHHANKVGLEWFMDKVWPLIKQRDNSFKLEIIGRWSPSTVSEWSRRYTDVHFMGFVDNLADALRGSTMIVPIFVGSGIRMKILEAMSYGVPFVSTVVGAEGIPVEDGVHGFITDDSDQFADDVIQLENPQTREEMIRRGRELVLARYSPEALARNKKEAYERLLGTL